VRGRVGAIVVAVGLCATGATVVSVAAQVTVDAPAAPGRLIDLGGWHMHVHCTGTRRDGAPLVVLESGVGDSSVEWSLVQPDVAPFARVCSYDRSGTAWSDLGPLPHTGRQIAFELAALLERAGEPPPYVLVGHSMGGRYVRIFTGMYRRAVAGIVFVDAGHEDNQLNVNGKLQPLWATASGNAVPQPKLTPPLTLDDVPADARRQIEAAARAGLDQSSLPPYNKLPPAAQAVRRWSWSQPKQFAANNSAFDGDEALAMRREREANPKPLGDLPVIVITRSQPITGLSAAALEPERQALQSQLAQLSTRGRQVVAPDSGHHVHIDAPAVVVAAIREIIAAGTSAARR
jgi:pimeloyl-ACP methyl ester carboxylesterase